MLLEKYIKSEDELLESYLTVVSQLVHRGELMKAFNVLQNIPAKIEDDEDILIVKSAVLKQLEKLASFNKHGTWNGRYNGGFTQPEDVNSITKFTHLEKKLSKLKLDNLLDVGCFSGWVGRELSKKGIAVHGIDIHPVVLQKAALVNSGSLATFQFLSAEKVGATYPRKYGGAILFDVLEHSFDPEVMLRSVERSIVKGGYVFINVPSVQGEAVANLHDLEEHEHLFNFTKKSLKKLIPYESIKIEKIKEDGVPSWFVTYQV